MTNSQEEKVYEQMLAMLADQFYHQPGANITINRAALADMLTKQTMHGIELGAAAERERIAEMIRKVTLTTAQNYSDFIIKPEVLEFYKDAIEATKQVMLDNLTPTPRNNRERRLHLPISN